MSPKQKHPEGLGYRCKNVIWGVIRGKSIKNLTAVRSMLVFEIEFSRITGCQLLLFPIVWWIGLTTSHKIYVWFNVGWSLW